MLTIAITVPIDALGKENQVVTVTFRRCKCGCMQYLPPNRPNQRFLTPKHRIDFHNKQRGKGAATA